MGAVTAGVGQGAAASVARALARAREHADLGAFWALDEEAAVRQAEALDARPRVRPAPPLLGATVAVKDLFDVAGLPTTAGLPGERAPAPGDAGLVQRLREAGAIPLGKAAMDPLGLTTGGQAPGFPPCRNPLDAALSPGGSSSGSAVAVAAGIADLGLGSDTAGSVRIPAAYCGIAALKPALGRLRRGGMTEVMGQWDVPGVLAPTIEEAIACFEVISGRPAPPRGNTRLRIGVLTDLLAESEPEVAAACRRAVAGLGRGFRVEDVELGWGGKGYGLILACEFEAIWGERVDRDPERFPELARSMVASARAAGRAGFAAVSESVGRERDRIRRRLGGFDAFICPTVPIPAPDAGDESVAVSSRFTRIFSALGWPAASIPAGSAGGRPVGIQVAALPSRFGALLDVARKLDRENPRGPGRNPPAA